MGEENRVRLRSINPAASNSLSALETLTVLRPSCSAKEQIVKMTNTNAPYPQVAADVVYDDAVFHEFLASLDGVNGIDFSDPAKLENYQQNFFSGVFGIDSAYLEEINKTLNLPIDTSAFEQGKVVLLSKTVEGLIQPGQEITIQTQNGQHQQ